MKRYRLSPLTWNTQDMMLALKEHLLNLLRRAGVSVDANVIEFQQIYRSGRKPAAHDKAYVVFRGVAEPDQIITTEELLEQFK